MCQQNISYHWLLSEPITIASDLHRAGLDVEHIMRLGGWESLDMVLRYTRNVKFEESLRLYHTLNKYEPSS